MAITWPTLALAFAGTLVVYNIDRLRDLELDRTTAPLRTAFVTQNRRSLLALVIFAAACAILLAGSLGPAVLGLCAVCIVPGLFHRRLKQHPGVKTLYVSSAWVAVTVGLPVFAHPLGTDIPRAAVLPWIVGIYAATLAANVIASNLRDTEHSRYTGRRERTLWTARGLTLAGILLSVFAGPPLWALLALPLTQAAALIRFHKSERYGLWVVDGALVLGSLLVIGFSR